MNYHFYYPPPHQDNLILRHKPISEEKQVLNFYLTNKDTDVKYQIYFSKMDLALFTKSQVSYFWCYVCYGLESFPEPPYKFPICSLNSRDFFPHLPSDFINTLAGAYGFSTFHIPYSTTMGHLKFGLTVSTTKDN